MSAAGPNRLAELRSASRLTRREVAAELDTTERTIYRWEAQEVGIPDAKKLALAQLFGVTVTWLMCWEGQNGNGVQQATA